MSTLSLGSVPSAPIVATPASDVQTLLQDLRKRSHIMMSQLVSPQDMKTFVEPVKFVDYEAPTQDNQSGTLTVGMPSEYFADLFMQRYGEAFTFVVEGILGKGVILLADIPQSGRAEGVNPADIGMMPSPRKDTYQTGLNNAYTFDSFYESESNRIALLMANAVASNPGQMGSNPLFIHGPSGVGKTHLSQAIGKQVELLYPGKRVCYVTSTQFEAQYTQDSRNKDRASFVSFYQQMDVLIMDDVQFLVGKEKTQQAFFEIFNHLYLLGKQIIITSDTKPMDMHGLEDRLISRIQSSLSIPIDRPDPALRRKIVSSKASAHGLELSPEVVELIVSQLTQHVRALEGFVNTLAMKVNITKTPITYDFVLGELANAGVAVQRQELSIDDILKAVCEHFDISEKDLRSDTRKASINRPRQILMYLCKEHTGYSYKQIATQLGRKNHTTAMHGIRAIKELIGKDKEVHESVKALESRLLGQAS